MFNKTIFFHAVVKKCTYCIVIPCLPGLFVNKAWRHESEKKRNILGCRTVSVDTSSAPGDEPLKHEVSTRSLTLAWQFSFGVSDISCRLLCIKWHIVTRPNGLRARNATLQNYRNKLFDSFKSKRAGNCRRVKSRGWTIVAICSLFHFNIISVKTTWKLN